MQQHNRRTSLRKKVYLPVKIVAATTPGGEAIALGDAPFIARDLSGKGMGIDSALELKAGSVLQMEFRLEEENRTLRMHAKVLKAHMDKTHNPNAPYRIGLLFIGVSDPDREYLESYVTRSVVLI